MTSRTFPPVVIIRIAMGTRKNDVEPETASKRDILFLNDILHATTCCFSFMIKEYSLSKLSMLCAKVLTTGIPRTYSTNSAESFDWPSKYSSLIFRFFLDVIVAIIPKEMRIGSILARPNLQSK